MHEQIVDVMNSSNQKIQEHSEKSAAATELIAYVLLMLVLAAAIFVSYKFLIKYERMRQEARINHAISLNNVTSTACSDCRQRRSTRQDNRGCEKPLAPTGATRGIANRPLATLEKQVEKQWK